MTAEPVTPGGVLTRRGATPFEVHLTNFEGPFDLLLGLISKHRLDITEVALAQVTDEFIAHLSAMKEAGGGASPWDLSQTSEFLLVAATLLDLKAARLLPDSTLGGDDEDLELIEARDLLFARLLQYRAFKQVASSFADAMASTAAMTPRQAGLEPQFAKLLPELVLTITPEQLAMIAAAALAPKEPPTVGLTHLHGAPVSVREQAQLLAARLQERGTLTFRELVADADGTLVIVARFLALLELFRERAVTMDQPEPLGEITVTWTGQVDGAVEVSDEFDAPPVDENGAPS